MPRGVPKSGKRKQRIDVVKKKEAEVEIKETGKDYLCKLCGNRWPTARCLHCRVDIV